MLKNRIHRRGLPAELINELFGSMPLENAFELLAKMPNGLLARNVQKMVNGTKEGMKENKLNAWDCGSKLTISDDGLEAKYNGISNGRNSVRAIFPIPSFNLIGIKKPAIKFYFEVEIIEKIISDWLIWIGFCCDQFSLEYKWLDLENNSNSIAFGSKYGIWIDGFWNKFAKDNGYFKKGDFAGLGIIQHPNSADLECFFTVNGHFIGKAKLPAKFADLQLFPVIHLHFTDDTIRVHFKKEDWKFKNFKCYLEL